MRSHKASNSKNDQCVFIIELASIYTKYALPCLLLLIKKFVAGRQSLWASNIQKKGLGKENLETINYAQFPICYA